MERDFSATASILYRAVVITLIDNQSQLDKETLKTLDLPPDSTTETLQKYIRQIQEELKYRKSNTYYIYIYIFKLKYINSIYLHTSITVTQLAN